MNELSTEFALMKEDLFFLFKQQLKKDFESSSLGTDFIAALPAEFYRLRQTVMDELKPVFKSQLNALQTLLYRIDVSEKQLLDYTKQHPDLRYEEVVAELIIKRILQKVILKKRFSA